jgi:hypothetical protein
MRDHRRVTALEDAALLIESRPDYSHFVGARTEAVVGADETALGVQFPPAYRAFVLRYGAGSFGSLEVYGVIAGAGQGLPDVVWATRFAREAPSNLPTSMIVIGADGMGGDYVLDTAKGQDPPVEVWEGGHSQPAERLERVAEDFGSFLLGHMRRQLER